MTRTVAISRGTGSSSPLDRAITVVLWAMAAVNAVFFFGLVAADGATTPLLNVWVSSATQWLPALALWLVAARARFSSLPVLLAAAGVTFNALGDTYYALSMDAEGYLPFPSPADAGYLLFYPLLVAALVALAAPRLRGAGRLTLLETAVAMTGASAMLAVVLDPVIRAAVEGDDTLAGVMALAYPLGDLVLLAVLAGIGSVLGGGITGRWWAAVTGLLIFVVGDVVYALLEHEGTYLAGTPLDATWAVGLAFITWWAAGMSEVGDSSTAPTARRHDSGVQLPAIAVIGGLVVLVLGTQQRLSVVAIVLAAITVGLGSMPIIFRQAMLGRMLAAREEAVRRLTQLDQDKTDIMVTLNHEFRTPLTSITGHVELLLDGAAGQLPPTAVGMLETIERNGARLESLIEAMLTVSALQHEDAPLERAPVDAGELVARLVADVRSGAARHGVELEFERPEHPIVLSADAEQLGRAIRALVDNAVKFTEPGGQVIVSLEADPDAGSAVVHVHDTGIGIPAADVERLFGRFFRASNVQNAAIPGAGLGLSIAQDIVSAHGGSIDVESELGEGTTMRVVLPAQAMVRT